MIKLKKLLLPPFLPVALLLLLGAWVSYSEATGEVALSTVDQTMRPQEYSLSSHQWPWLEDFSSVATQPKKIRNKQAHLKLGEVLL